MKQLQVSPSMDNGLKLMSKTYTRDGSVMIDGKTYKLKPNKLNFYLNDIKRTINTRMDRTV